MNVILRHVRAIISAKRKAKSIKNSEWFLGFRREAEEKCVLPGVYAASGGNFLLTVSNEAS